MPEIILQRDGGIATIVMSNPPRRNAFTIEMRQTIRHHLLDLSVDSSCRAIILTGEGSDFSPGADLSKIGSDERQTPLESRAHIQHVHDLIRAISAGPKPVIAAVEGLAFGGGMALALACDFLIASQSARFGAAFARLGIIGDSGIMYTLRAKIGITAAKRAIALSTQFSAQDALDAGIADKLVDTGNALASARAEAELWAEAAPLSVAYTKAAFANGMSRIDDAFRAELDYLPIVIRSDDFERGLHAVKSKTKASFQGR